MNDFFSRAELLLGPEAISKLKNSNVAVFGIGGVGSYTVEALVRCSIGRLSLFDNDTVCASNINRQIIATSKTIGEKKVDIAKHRALEINPSVDITVNPVFYSYDNAKQIDLSCFDYIVDAIDTVSSKLTLIETAKKHDVPIISCMGAGNKLDPTRFEVSDISKTSVCPLAKVMRVELRRRGINHLKVVYSKEQPLKPTSESRTPGSVSFVPSVAGLIIAGEVIKDLSGINE
ncbi:MAG TPA: tRNA threonylcarbamoyladenosine dehydratase [Clostridia bacterium]|nr:tRNA threonylcarbamoyladenosine dehydratase [Clostridia bacterium]